MSTRPTAASTERPALAGPRLGAPATALGRLMRPLALAALALAAVLAANLIAVRLSPPGYTLDGGERHDRAAVPGFHGPQQDQAGTTYRWASGDAALILRGPATAGPATASLTLGWLPPGSAAPRELALALDGRPFVVLAAPDQPRRYTLLLPPGALSDGEARLGLRSETTVVPPDDRPLGVRVDAAAVGWRQGAWHLPPPVVIAAQLGLALLWVGVARQLGLGLLATAGVGLAVVGALVAHAALVPGLAAPWHGRLLGAGLMSAAVVWGAGRVLPQAEPDASAGFIRALLLITLIALAIRLMGVLFPLFFAHDQLVNSGRLRNVQLGELTLFDRPSEFSRRVAVVSPTAFILALPGTLVADRGLALQGLYALLDGTTPLLVGLLARRLGLGERAALVAAGLIALLPMQLTALYWGFVKQIVGQWLTLLFMVVLAGPTPRGRLGWVAATTLCAVNFLIHPGGLLLAGIAIGLYLLAGLWPRLRAVAAGRVAPRRALAGPDVAHWRGWALALLAASAVALAVQYADAARLMVGGMLDGSTATTDSTNQLTDRDALLRQIWVGLNASFAPMPLALVAAGLGALLWRTAGRARLLVGAWLASALLFLAVDIVTNQQVRYGYFSAPIVCAGVAALLEPMLPRPLGRAVAWALVAVVVAAGLALWASAIFSGVKPSVNPLTH
ncbi:MAG TPA: hypothetical protein PKD53_16690 [Chloroflexaceae bacterium]|nr:hypothetical protein [Chloroflexaceae bacterium]